MYEDKLPSEAKHMEDFVSQVKVADDHNNTNGAGREFVKFVSNKDYTLEQHQGRIDWVKNRLLPEEGRDHKKISKLRVQDFEKQAEKDRARANRDSHQMHMYTLKAEKEKGKKDAKKKQAMAK